MGTESKKNQSPEDEKESKTHSDLPEEDVQDDQLTLDSDMEVEDLVESINEKERSMKK